MTENSNKPADIKLRYKAPSSELMTLHMNTVQTERSRRQAENQSLVQQVSRSSAPIETSDEIRRLEYEYDGKMLRMERELQVRTQQMEQKLQEAQAETSRLLEQETVLRREIDRIYNSKSMRVTAPLRKMSQISRFWRK